MNITTKDDQELSGIVVKETDNELILRNAANQEVSVVKSKISERRNGASLMPAGLLDPLLPDERYDLIKFLSLLGKPGAYDTAGLNAARLWEFYQVTSHNEHLGMEGVTRGDFSRADWVRVFSLVNGELPRDLCESNAAANEASRGFFAATQCQSANGGRAAFKLQGEAKAAWVNGIAVQPGIDFTADLKPGTNTLVLQLDSTKLPRVVKLTSSDVTFLTN